MKQETKRLNELWYNNGATSLPPLRSAGLLPGKLQMSCRAKAKQWLRYSSAFRIRNKYNTISACPVCDSNLCSVLFGTTHKKAKHQSEILQKCVDTAQKNAVR